MAQITSRIVLSKAAMLRMLQEQGITDLQNLVQKGLEIAQADPVSESVDVYISSHFVYWHRD